MTQARIASKIKPHLMAFGWYLRRCPSADALMPFYRDVLALPVMRGRDPVYFLWGGETFVFELKGDKIPWGERDQDPASAPMVPTFRCTDLTQLLALSEKAGQKTVLRRCREHSDEAFVLDPDGQLIGLRQPHDNSPCYDDQIARRRAGRTPTYVNDWPEMSPLLPGFERVVRRVTDVDAAVAFYCDTIGFEVAGQEDDSVLLHCGDGFVMEIGPGGSRQKIPEDRSAITNYFVMRVDDHDAVNAGLKAAGVPLVNDRIEFNSATLTYAADPDGQIIGFEERLPPHQWKTWRNPFAEDIEADRRFAAYGMDPKREADIGYA